MMLTNKVLQDPMQRRFFKSQWLQDLFTLDDRGHNARGGGGAAASGRAGVRRGGGRRGQQAVRRPWRPCWRPF
jgi:hypothetical protein